MSHSAEYLRGAKWAFHEAGEPLAASKMSQLLAEAEAREAALDAAAVTLRQIAELGGNLTDDKLTSRTGPNDAVQRGLMYVEARRLALEALSGMKSTPDAAAVIATCHEALEKIRADVTTTTGQCGVLGTNWAECDDCGAVSTARKQPIPHEAGCAVALSTDCLAAISAWEAIHG